ncbi:hypothetical protein PR003_g12707 [Phytophthora rubi]|uniref:GH16 domain-containing protein n=1 Tax=Phytophthora rubi TaxID=129364 RepID=A0A6A3M683_9STRA|nr:hypothetical protein PR002_g11136 [Phytophthora rubi]KAE9027495.1 hypothetical protein PR001_g11949 [Phytophthora rubi]KAE9336028.1 hypothetical protein PR003_g12707 [Phytophthora rubi]
MFSQKHSTWSLAATLALALATTSTASPTTSYSTKSGVLPWVDVDTPPSAQTYTSSRGDLWTLTMSDEFNTAGRTFDAGDDHLWTALELPDGVNSALEVYSKNMTGTECDTDGNCYFYINTTDEVIEETVWNNYISPPGYQTVHFYYRSGMVQTWNKFCFQGGMIEVRARLPGAVSSASGNPDVKTGSTTVRAANVAYYPTWPGIWMMGNLGRALFTGSTSRMWPFTYNECNETIFDSQNQRISACDDNPGSGMNPNQGRGAPEIDILEGGGTAISSSIQVGPGMPEDFRLIQDTASSSCFYTYDCTTKGANNQDVPTKYYWNLRGHKSWYQGLRYAANNLCDAKSADVQSFATVNASLTQGITANACTMELCPASYDVNGDLGYKDNGSVTGNLVVTVITQRLTSGIKRQVVHLMGLLVLNFPALIIRGDHSGAVRYVTTGNPTPPMHLRIGADGKLAYSSQGADSRDMSPVTSHQDLTSRVAALLGDQVDLEWVHPHPRVQCAPKL